jgi:hypothetical protein
LPFHVTTLHKCGGPWSRPRYPGIADIICG